MTTTDPAEQAIRTVGAAPSTAPQPAPLDLDLIEARCDAATRGPWWAWDRGVGWCIALDQPDDEGNPTDYLPDGMRTDIGRRGDAQFIAHARQDVPRLVAEVRRLRAELERWRTGRRWHSLPPVPAVPDAIPHAAAMIRAASDDELPEPVADLLRSGAQRLKSAADAYGIVAAKLAEATADRLTGAGQTYETVIARLRAELDAAPAAPRTFALPAEPPPEVTELWDHEGVHWRRVEPQPPYGADWVTAELLVDKPPQLSVEATDWAELVYAAGPLSTVPPAGTEGDRG